MIRLSSEHPLADLAEATGLSDGAIAIARGGKSAQTQHRSRHAGAEVSVRVLEESVRATGRELVLLAVSPEEMAVLKRITVFVG